MAVILWHAFDAKFDFLICLHRRPKACFDVLKCRSGQIMCNILPQLKVVVIAASSLQAFLYLSLEVFIDIGRACCYAY